MHCLKVAREGGVDDTKEKDRELDFSTRAGRCRVRIIGDRPVGENFPALIYQNDMEFWRYLPG